MMIGLIGVTAAEYGPSGVVSQRVECVAPLTTSPYSYQAGRT